MKEFAGPSGFRLGPAPLAPTYFVAGTARCAAQHILAAARLTLLRIVIGGLRQEDERICWAERISARASRAQVCKLL